MIQVIKKREASPKRKQPKIIQKLKSQSGISLSEMIVAILIMTMTMTTIAQSVSVFHNIYKKLVLKSEAMSVIATVSSIINADLKSASNMTFNADDNLEFFHSDKRGYDIRFTNGKQEEENGDRFDAIVIETYDYEEETGTKYIPLIPSAGYAKKLSSKLQNGIQKIDGCYEYTIEIYNRVGTLIESQKCVIKVKEEEEDGT